MLTWPPMSPHHVTVPEFDLLRALLGKTFQLLPGHGVGEVGLDGRGGHADMIARARYGRPFTDRTGLRHRTLTCAARGSAERAGAAAASCSRSACSSVA